MRSTRLAIGAALAVAGAMTPITTLAHAGLVSSSPAPGVTLASPPEAVTLVFDGELGPDGTGFTVTDPDGSIVGEGELDLAVAERNEVSGRVMITDPGTYAVTWTAVASDGHEETGDFTFTVAVEPPNTAASPADPDVSRTAGAILLMMAVASGLWRTRRAVS